MAHTYNREDRPAWPRRAVVTAGMPYGNKGLHFGHVGGVFVPADFYARFPLKSLPFLVSEKGEAVQLFRRGSMGTVDAV